MFTKRKAFSGSGLTKMTSVDCCDVDLRDRFGRTPLMYAVLGNYPACVEVAGNVLKPYLVLETLVEDVSDIC